ncbi:hypothetical protein O181_049748 [Austropuccinia psidii MF-1]|uniref:Uncharacterized protein n=1 Tax=Austropuccinia psidii MF-1 TaxID=1389203 RepID=A0A9Q3DY33_9BASI|nr:hypothetical protein [Austropuccinia psidii MF-1]
MPNCTLLAIKTFHWHIMATGHILPSLALLANSSPHQLPGHLGPLWPLWPTVRGTIRPPLAQIQWGQKGPRGKFISPQSQVGPKPQVGLPEQVLAPNPNLPKLAKNHLRRKIDQGPQVGHFSTHGLWKPPEATSSAPRKDFPSAQGKTFPSSMHPILKDPGVVHIWYNIPLCTIFAQKSNGDIFKTQLCDYNPSFQSTTNFEGGYFSYSVWQFPGSYQKAI